MAIRRYYWQRRKTIGGYQIHDRTLKLPVALCNYKEQAELVSTALNFWEQEMTVRKQSVSKGEPQSVKPLNESQPIPASDSAFNWDAEDRRLNRPG